MRDCGVRALAIRCGALLVQKQPQNQRLAVVAGFPLPPGLV
jgi:hypothetical protein